MIRKIRVNKKKYEVAGNYILKIRTANFQPADHIIGFFGVRDKNQIAYEVGVFLQDQERCYYSQLIIVKTSRILKANWFFEIKLRMAIKKAMPSIMVNVVAIENASPM